MRELKVPNGWSKEYLGNLSIDGIKNGVFNDPKKVGKGTKLINVVNLYSGSEINTEKLTRLNLTEQEITKYKVEVGDLFFTRSSLALDGIARCNIILDGSEDIVYDGHIMRVRPNIEKVIPFYLKEYCLGDNAKGFFMRHAKTTTMTTIGQQEISKLPVLIPPLKEQEKIVSILSTWDKAIELKKKLIGQKKAQKIGLMQKLLTGEIRLAGYKSDWCEVNLGSILNERKEVGFEQLELLAITAKKGVVKRTEVDIRDNSSENKSKYKRILPNDIGYNTMRMWQGVLGVSKYEGIVSPAYTVLEPTEQVDSNFIGYLFKLPKVINSFRRYSQGLVDDTLNLKYENFKVIKVEIPNDKKEQEKIAEILLCIDKEIEVLRNSLREYEMQKQALMQQLLTGKIRVKV